MKRTIRFFWIAIGLGSACTPLNAETFRWKWTEGETLRYLRSQTIDVQTDAGDAGDTQLTLRQSELDHWTVESVDEEGAAKLSRSITRIFASTRGPAGETFQYDTTSDELPVGMAAVMAPRLDAMTAGPLIVTVLPTGEITDTQPSEDLAEALKRLRSEAFPPDVLMHVVRQGLVAFPQNELAPGLSWTTKREVPLPDMGRLIASDTYTLTETIEEEGRTLATFAMNSTIASDEGEDGDTPAAKTLSSEGRLVFDNEEGRVDYLKSHHEYEIQSRHHLGAITPSAKSLVKLSLVLRYLDENDPDSLQAEFPLPAE